MFTPAELFRLAAHPSPFAHQIAPDSANSLFGEFADEDMRHRFSALICPNAA
jgi:hypothetical protein